MTEAELLTAVTALARERGLRALHVPDHLVHLMGADWSGFPDLLLIGPGGVVWAELKADGRAGQLRPSQRGFRRLMISAGHTYVTWDPGDLRCGMIMETVAQLAMA